MKIARAATAVLACAVLGAVGVAPVDAAASEKAPAVTTLSPEQRAALKAELARYLRQDSDGLVSRVRADGALTVELDGRFQHAIVVRPKDGGGRELACFDDADAAVAFLARDDRRAAPMSTDGASRAPQPGERDR